MSISLMQQQNKRFEPSFSLSEKNDEKPLNCRGVCSVAARYLNYLLWLFKNRAATERTPLQFSGLLNKYNFKKIIFSFVIFSICSTAFALEEDKTQPMYVQADSVAIDNQSGKSEYTGNVTVDQGSTHLRAAHAIVYTESGKNTLKEAVAEGDKTTQAHYWTLTDPKKPELNAYADTIKVFPQKNLVYLIGHAKVIQGADSFEAPEIQYDSKTQKAFSPKSKLGKTVIVIHPQAQPKP